ncbi:MAG TPA: hypothetical protein VEX13_12905, partial [Chloroflexia bacterium]|nr:hypothetical protein [Chloroflexia bacterium]
MLARSLSTCIVIIAAVALAASMPGSTNLAARYAPPLTQADCREFPETGKRVCARFLTYWQEHGGLAQQGYPISGEFMEKSQLDGQTYRVQYFERAVFELHPENQPPYDVLLSQLGTFQFKQKYPQGEPVSAPPTPTGDPYATLRQRPLQLPTVGPSAPCPAVTGKVVAPAFGAALGNGPVYPVGLGTEGITAIGGNLEEGGWIYVKVLWISDLSRYNGPVLVRGGRIDSPGELRFGSGPNPSTELQLDPSQGTNSAPGWQDWPTYTRLRAPGCYAFQ